MSNYTPTTEDIVRVLRSDGTISLTQFDRWVAEHDRLVGAATLREAASDPEIQDNRPWVEWWLRTRAQQLLEKS